MYKYLRTGYFVDPPGFLQAIILIGPMVTVSFSCSVMNFTSKMLTDIPSGLKKVSLSPTLYTFTVT